MSSSSLHFSADITSKIDAGSSPNLYLVCPRKRKAERKNQMIAGQSKSKVVALSLEILKPFFTKPLTQASEELGLSATAIKKACRKFGVPKWPARTLTSKTSRNRVAVVENINDIRPHITQLCDAATLPDASTVVSDANTPTGFDEQSDPSTMSDASTEVNTSNFMMEFDEEDAIFESEHCSGIDSSEDSDGSSRCSSAFSGDCCPQEGSEDSDGFSRCSSALSADCFPQSAAALDAFNGDTPAQRASWETRDTCPPPSCGQVADDSWVLCSGPLSEKSIRKFLESSDMPDVPDFEPFCVSLDLGL